MIRADQSLCVGVWVGRTRVRGQAGSVDGQSDIVSAFGGAGQIRAVDLLEAGLETVLLDGGEGGSRKREIQGILVLLGGEQVEDDAIEISAGHINRNKASASKNGIMSVKIAVTNLASPVSLSLLSNVLLLGLLEALLESGLNDAVCLLENDHGDGRVPKSLLTVQAKKQRKNLATNFGLNR